MTWTEMKKTTEPVKSIKSAMIDKMKSVFPFLIVDGTTVFSLPNGLFMNIFSMRGDDFDALGMEYGEKQEYQTDDGDLYYISDYESLDDMFQAMLEETHR